jgi:hypothetical protein
VNDAIYRRAARRCLDLRQPEAAVPIPRVPAPLRDHPATEERSHRFQAMPQAANPDDDIEGELLARPIPHPAMIGWRLPATLASIATVPGDSFVTNLHINKKIGIVMFGAAFRDAPAAA